MKTSLIFVFLILLPAPPLYSLPNDFNIADCGVLYDGVEAGCLMIDTYENEDYILLAYPHSFSAGDTVYVEGEVDVGCNSYCMEGDGCLTASKVAACDIDSIENVVIAGVLSDWICVYLNAFDGHDYELRSETVNPFNDFAFGDSVVIYGHFISSFSFCMLGDIVNIDSIFAYKATDINDLKQPDSYSFSLSYNCPNPFNMATVINYSLAKYSHVNLSIYDITGRKIKTLVDESKAVGEHSAIWDGTDDDNSVAATGIYLYRIETPEFMASRKLILLK